MFYLLYLYFADFAQEYPLLNLLQYQTLIATKAARVRLAAPDRRLVDFGLRRAHGDEAGLLSARTRSPAVASGLRRAAPGT